MRLKDYEYRKFMKSVCDALDKVGIPCEDWIENVYGDELVTIWSRAQALQDAEDTFKGWAYVMSNKVKKRKSKGGIN